MVDVNGEMKPGNVGVSPQDTDTLPIVSSMSESRKMNESLYELW